MYAVGINGSIPYPVPNQLNNPAILYYQLDGKNDSVRYVWSLVGTPTLFMSVVPAEHNENCSDSIHNMLTEWDKFINNQSSGSIDIPGYNEDFGFSIVFNKLIEFTDKNHKAYNSFDPNDLNNTAKYRAVNTSGLDWFFDGKKMELVARELNYNASLPKQFSWIIKVNYYIVVVVVVYICCCLYSYMFQLSLIVLAHSQKHYTPKILPCLILFLIISISQTHLMVTVTTGGLS